jgi:hypothetical protein
MSPENKNRRSSVAMATLLALSSALIADGARQAQINHTVLNFKAGSWFTPEVGYIVAFCFFVMAAVLVVSAFRKSNDEQH